MENNNLLNLFEAEIIGKEVKNKKYGSGKIVSINKFDIINNKYDVFVEILFGDEELKKVFALLYSVTNNSLEPEASLKTIIEDNKTNFEEEYNKIVEKEKEENDKVLAELAEEQKAENEAAAIEKFSERKKSKKLSNIALSKELSNSCISLTDNFVTEIGYLATHTTKLLAAVPDYLESWFISEFGSKHKYSLKKSNEKSIASFLFKLHFSSTSDMPKSLTYKCRKVKDRDEYIISDMTYIYNLCKYYGFIFGCTQDESGIALSIPTSYSNKYITGKEFA